MVFAWLATFFQRALTEEGAEELGTTPVPHAHMQAPLVLKRCAEGRSAAGGALTIVCTQLPFPYVHLLSMLVQVACVTNAVSVGAHTGEILLAPTCTGDAALPTEHRFRYESIDGCPPAAAPKRCHAAAGGKCCPENGQGISGDQAASAA